ncbi:MFS general substrate transporter [Aspergillus saccharolyticus JOP 1030-1]|uniref:MFS general substrate transporter n=1 Tax=Aspergillus saccharolyticus JOP 1030-1 TaxID=1450539 RepID=A0A318ZHU8_9EURO|nr:MFS general substrate transporter [Aspergillus saccharolyticus JOP 1030-1]PYH46505.1 MFS general substrate transporter [Aspergillus saccharolyticus JOP 1030-1]
MHYSERDSNSDSGDSEVSPLIPGPPVAISPPTPSKKQILKVILLCASATLILDIGLTVVLAPKIRLLESILCQEYYHTHGLQGLMHDIPESQCKTKEIQSAVARLIGWQAVFDSLPAIFLAIPYGALSDTKGRRPVLLLCFLGLTLSTAWTLLICWLRLPLELTWISSLFQCLGGGPAVATAIVEATIADVVPDDKRSTIYFQLQAAVLISDILANPLSAVLMAHNVWIPCFLGLSIQALGTILLMALPETLSFARALSPLAESTSDCVEEEERLTLRGRLVKNFRSIVSDRNVAGLVFGLLVLTISAESVDFLLQYVSKRYGWSIAKSAMLLSLRAAVEFGLLLILGPLLLFLSWPSLRNPLQRDLWVARVSLGFIVLGFLILALSPTVASAILGLIIYTLGAGFQPAVMSLLGSVWKASNPTNLGSLYSTVAIILAAGGVIAGPLLSFMFQLGLRLGDAWVGLPYFVSACLCAGIALVMLSVRLPSRPIASEM